MSRRTNRWHDHWLDLDCDGQPLKAWCINSRKEPGFAHCRVCKLTIKYLNIGVRALKDHGKSRKHLENCKAAVHSPRKKSTKLSPVPPTVTPKGSKKLLRTLDIEASKSQTQRLSAKVTPPDCIYFKPQTVVDTGLGPLPYYHISENESRNSLIPVYPCCYCPEEFLSKQLLHDHQTSCIMKPPILQAVTPSDSDSLQGIPEDEILSPVRTPMHSPVLKSSKSEGSSFNNQLMQQSKKEFISGLNLLPKKKARQVCRKRRNTECESIDLDEEIPLTPTTPSTNRTPKLLISHLSRDGYEHHRRHLSFSTDGKSDKENNSTLDGDSQEMKDKDETEDQERKVTVCKSLYNLDVTSPLGQFVIKHFKGDPSLHILSDIESHCLTSSAPKNSSISRLRVRNITYPITFRGYSGKSFRNFVHQYKYKKKQVKEFMKTVNTGLNKRSRHLKRQMKPCKVILKHLTKADLRFWIPRQNILTVDLKPLTASEIAFWTTPKHSPSMDNISVFPKGLKFTSPNVNSVLGLRIRQSHALNSLKASSLTLSHFVSEDVCAELVQNRKVLYRSLLSDCSSKECYEGGNVYPTRPPAFSILKQMLNQVPTYCDSKSLNDMSKASTSKTNSSLPCHRGVNNVRNSMEAEKEGGFAYSGHLSPLSSPETQDIQDKGSAPPNKPPFKKIKLFGSLSHGNGMQSLFQQNKMKVLGGFTVDTRTASEGEKIMNATENPQLNHFVKIESKRRKQCNDLKGEESSSKVNGLLLLKRTLRSSSKEPFSKQSVEGKDNSQNSMQTSQEQETTSDFKSTRRKNTSVAKKTMMKCLRKENVFRRMNTRLQNAKTCQNISHKPLSKLKGDDRLKHIRNRSNKRRPSADRDPSTCFQRKLRAAGLERRECVSTSSLPFALGKKTEPTVPQPTNTLKAVTPQPDNDGSIYPLKLCSVVDKYDSRNLVLKRVKSYPSACTYEVPSNQHGNISHGVKNEKHKKFLQWLQTLRK